YTRAPSRAHPRDDCCSFPAAHSLSHAVFLFPLWELLSPAPGVLARPGAFQPAMLFLSPRHRVDAEDHLLAIASRRSAHSQWELWRCPQRMDSSSFRLPPHVGAMPQFPADWHLVCL